MNSWANCWDIKNCGRGPGGEKLRELGLCPAASDKVADGTNHGTNGGRICWTIAGTFCGGKVQGTFARKLATCRDCEVFTRVGAEEGKAFKPLHPDQERGLRPHESGRS